MAASHPCPLPNGPLVDTIVIMPTLVPMGPEYELLQGRALSWACPGSIQNMTWSRWIRAIGSMSEDMN